MAAHVELAAVLAVMVVGGTLGGRWVLWEFRHRRHQERVAAARLEPVRVGEGDPRFGSMQLDDDWAPSAQDAWAAMVADSRWATYSMLASSPMTAELDWREQTMAELSPEALEHPQGPQAAVSWGTGPGPGAGSSSAPGPGGLAPLAPPEPGVGDGIEWAVNAAVKPPAGPVSGAPEQFRTPANAWEQSERLAHTWDRLPVILNTETIAEWGARCREEVAAWPSEPWAARLPWETEMIT